ncbi:MAG: hypothetical protein IPF47_26085 [Gemmatimonadetes bacterium]|nr:hypothetical protein [Gemmatimonadota bacterium]
MTLAAVASVPGCARSPIGGTPAEQLGRLESLYADTRDLYFQIYVPDARGTERNARGVSLPEMRRAHRALRERLTESLEALDDERFGGEDREAVRVMLRQLAASASIETASGEAAAGAVAGADRCDYAPSALAAGDSGFARLSGAHLRCYGDAARAGRHLHRHQRPPHRTRTPGHRAPIASGAGPLSFARAHLAFGHG